MKIFLISIKYSKTTSSNFYFKTDQTNDAMSNIKQTYIMIHYEPIYYELELVTSLEIIRVLSLSHSEELY